MDIGMSRNALMVLRRKPKASAAMLIRHTQTQCQVSHQWALHLLLIPF